MAALPVSLVAINILTDTTCSVRVFCSLSLFHTFLLASDLYKDSM